MRTDCSIWRRCASMRKPTPSRPSKSLSKSLRSLASATARKFDSLSKSTAPASLIGWLFSKATAPVAIRSAASWWARLSDRDRMLPAKSRRGQSIDFASPSGSSTRLSSSVLTLRRVRASTSSLMPSSNSQDVRSSRLIQKGPLPSGKPDESPPPRGAEYTVSRFQRGRASLP